MSKVKYIAEGGSSNKPPLFDGSNYYFWKVITDGDFVPTTKEGVVKENSAWSTDDQKGTIFQIFINNDQENSLFERSFRDP
ncbi:hypothetical protein MTR_5g045120 [Medicago truncatula]|uniref:Uncharacterized protein n=1 Tax=Medicago truncatula TaxID=3880 RepID=G7JY27_MEDTR|nr:hypothetical protein MTR_5g045120 [Medicago truncatula]